MTEKIGTNIRALRKSRALTQEQLAEAIGVTGGAVYKWEARLSTPDLETLMELADFFGVSVDALLGFELQGQSVDALIARMEAMQREKDDAHAVAEAEKALRRYPNNFRVAYYCARLFRNAALARPEKREGYGRRALELFQRALALIDQNTDPQIGLLNLQIQIADVYVLVGEYDKAVQLLKQNNQNGENNASIGRILASSCRRAEEGLPYLSAALYDHMAALYEVVIGFANAYSLTQEDDQSIALMLWFMETCKGLRQPGKSSCLDRWDAGMLLACAETAANKGDWQAARHYLTQAREAALKFDAAPVYGMEHLKFNCGSSEHRAYGPMGETALEELRRHLLHDDEAGQLLIPIWEEIN